VSIEGKSYSSCSLKNTAYLAELITNRKMMIGDIIHIIMKDTNIPIVIGVAVHNNETDITIPSNCPSCNSQLHLINHKFICNNQKCPIKIKDILINYFELANIGRFDETMIFALIEKFNITSVADLKSVNKNEILKFQDGEDIFRLLNTKQTISKQQLIDLSQPINIGIGVIGHFMSNLDINLLLDERTNADDVIDLSMVDEDSKEELKSTINYQLEIIRKNSKHFKIKDLITNSLNNATFCLTNTMKKDTMKNYEKKIIENGGRIGSVSMKLDFLVTNKTNNTKYNKVINLNTKLYNKGNTHSIHIIDESELLKMMEK
jgi:DNA ligase (NAD+)